MACSMHESAPNPLPDLMLNAMPDTSQLGQYAYRRTHSVRSCLALLQCHKPTAPFLFCCRQFIPTRTAACDNAATVYTLISSSITGLMLCMHMQGGIYPKLAGHIAHFLAQTLFKTSLIALSTTDYRCLPPLALLHPESPETRNPETPSAAASTNECTKCRCCVCARCCMLANLYLSTAGYTHMHVITCG